MNELLRIVDARRDLAGAVRTLRQLAQAVMPPVIVERTAQIVEAVRERGDDALVEYTRRFDWPEATAEALSVEEAELEAAYGAVQPRWLAALRRAKDNLYRYHERQAPRSWMQDFDGLLLGQLIKPIASAGIHVPGAAAPLPSTVIHCAVPAAVAGVPRAVMVTPPRRDGSVSPERLVAACECGVAEVYRVGGAQAIAALAFGTETIQPVDKVVGPGNVYVTAAKRLVYGEVGIDGLAGPSEAVIIADELAPPDVVAADLLAQAEHSGDNLAVLITTSEPLVDAVVEHVQRLLTRLDRDEIICESLAEAGAIVLVESMQQAIDLANQLAPEHLQLMVDDAEAWIGEVQAAGAVFVGLHSAVPLGDYIAGPSHVLPTGRAARFSSGLSVSDFVTCTSVVSASRRALLYLADDCIALAEAEELTAHAEAIRCRVRHCGQ